MFQLWCYIVVRTILYCGSDERGYFQNKKLQKKDDDKDDADENEDLNDSNFDEVCILLCSVREALLAQPGLKNLLGLETNQKSLKLLSPSFKKAMCFLHAAYVLMLDVCIMYLVNLV